MAAIVQYEKKKIESVIFYFHQKESVTSNIHRHAYKADDWQGGLKGFGIMVELRVMIQG